MFSCGLPGDGELIPAYLGVGEIQMSLRGGRQAGHRRERFEDAAPLAMKMEVGEERNTAPPSLILAL